MVFVWSPCNRGISRAQFVAFANGSVYPVPPLVVVVDPLPAKSSDSFQSCYARIKFWEMLTLIGHSSDEAVGEVVSKLLLYRNRATYNSVPLVL